tara:strand:- start:3144 stop:3311 length:168 start_codon:yes stop_codon:yes gene_type:complete
MNKKKVEDNLQTEDAPMNATGAAVSTDANSIGFKKRNKKYEPNALFTLLKRNINR